MALEHRMRTRWVRMASWVPVLAFGVVLVAAAELPAQQAHLAITPARPLPGAIVRLSLTDGASASDAIVGVAGTMAGEPLHFVGSGGSWRAIAVGRQSQSEPPRWSAPFERPRDSDISSGFGTGRTFNGQVASRHLGVDFRGAAGSPIRAANAGVVVLVDTFFLGGRVVYIDH